MKGNDLITFKCIFKREAESYNGKNTGLVLRRAKTGIN